MRMNCYFRHFVPLIWYSSAPSTQKMSSKVWRVLNFGVSSSVVISVIAAALTFGLKQYIPQMFTPDKWVIVCLDNDAMAWKRFPNYWCIARTVHRDQCFPSKWPTMWSFGSLFFHSQIKPYNNDWVVCYLSYFNGRTVKCKYYMPYKVHHAKWFYCQSSCRLFGYIFLIITDLGGEYHSIIHLWIPLIKGQSYGNFFQAMSYSWI